MDIDEYFQTNLTNNLSTYLERTVTGIFLIILLLFAYLFSINFKFRFN